MKTYKIPRGFHARLTDEKGKETELSFEHIKQGNGSTFRLTALPNWGDPVEFPMSLTDLQTFISQIQQVINDSNVEKEAENE